MAIIFYENNIASQLSLKQFTVLSRSERYINSKVHSTKRDIKMIAEFSVIPIGVGESLSRYVAECLKIVREGGMNYQLTPMGTIVEGDYDKVMETVGLCHKKVRSMTARVVTTVRIDDRAQHSNEIERKIKSVEEKIED